MYIGNIIGSNAGATLAASEASSRAMRAETDVAMLTSRVDALELSCAALFKLLKEKHGYSNEDLVKAIHEIDMEDGKADGKLTRQMTECPHCHRRILARNSTKCLWCGAVINPSPIL